MEKTSPEYIINLVSTEGPKQQKAIARALHSLLTFYKTTPFSKVEEYFVKKVLEHYNKTGEITGIYLSNSIDLCSRYAENLSEIALNKENLNRAAKEMAKESIEDYSHFLS
jgi:hypothetical protein